MLERERSAKLWSSSRTDWGAALILRAETGDSGVESPPALLTGGFVSREAPVAAVGDATEVLTVEGLPGTLVRLPAGSCDRLEMDEGREVALPACSGYRQLHQKEMVISRRLGYLCMAQRANAKKEKGSIELHVIVQALGYLCSSYNAIDNDANLGWTDKDTMHGLAVKVAFALDDTAVFTSGQVEFDTDPSSSVEGCCTDIADVAQVPADLDSHADVDARGLTSRVRHDWVSDG